MKKICVIGSLNVDMVVRLPRFHGPGETITGSAFDIYAGGKGGNQAVATANLMPPGSVLMAGKLGGDANGAFYRNVLDSHRIDGAGIEAAEGATTGIALIEVDAGGENRIALVPGANALVDRAQIDRLLPQLCACDLFLLQLEIPLDTVIYAAQQLRERGKTVILDPAPAVALPDDLLRCIDYLTPNETELALLSGMPTSTPEEVRSAARSLIKRGAHAVLAKMGARGAMYVDAGDDFTADGFTVDVVDTTGAGDSFNAGFAVAQARGDGLVEAIRFANAVAALSTTGAGAQAAMPTLAQAIDFLKGAGA